MRDDPRIPRYAAPAEPPREPDDTPPMMGVPVASPASIPIPTEKVEEPEIRREELARDLSVEFQVLKNRGRNYFFDAELTSIVIIAVVFLACSAVGVWLRPVLERKHIVALIGIPAAFLLVCMLLFAAATRAHRRSVEAIIDGLERLSTEPINR